MVTQTHNISRYFDSRNSEQEPIALPVSNITIWSLHFVDTELNVKNKKETSDLPAKKNVLGKGKLEKTKCSAILSNKIFHYT